MTALGSVRHEWKIGTLFGFQEWSYSNLFFMEGIYDVAFSIGVRLNNGYLDVCVGKSNLKLAKAVIKIAINEENRKKEINNWKDNYIFDNYIHDSKLGVSTLHHENGAYCHFISDTTIVCTITWYGFVGGVSGSNFYQELQQFHKATEFSDVILSVDGAELPAHKIILSSHSPVFFAMLTADMKEKKESRINIENFEVDVINEMLTYFYTGETKASEDVDTALKMLELANMYQINKLKDICEQTLLKKMKVDNVLLILVAADDFNSQNLYDESIKFMVSNRKEVVKLPGFKDLLKTKTEIRYNFIYASFETKQ
ncbi:TD and POZ domain-containing protein 2-like [Microplitis mediator]|uniref:TD and POZ domain-containing protein 2-like n=1 Tax=Microplitis mediator TaxID=375433 RepID=UPI0025556FCE|nr:TD and POZ domain-containing protein 2-like [Microplitis mediator]